MYAGWKSQLRSTNENKDGQHRQGNTYLSVCPRVVSGHVLSCHVVLSWCELVQSLEAVRAYPPRKIGGALPEKLGGGVRPTSQNPCPIQVYLWPKSAIFPPLFMTDQKFDALFMTAAAGTVALNSSPKHNFWRAFVDGHIDNVEKLASSKKHTQIQTKVQKPYPIYDQNNQNRYPFYDQNG